MAPRIGPAQLVFYGLAFLGLIFALGEVRQQLGGSDTSLSSYVRSGVAGNLEGESPGLTDAVAEPIEPLVGRGLPGALRPYGNPLRAPNTVMTQDYGVGTHAPAEIWGAVDLALDGDGDGLADPEGSWDQPVYATHSGVVTTTPNSYPAGNHIWVSNDEYRTGYAHLSGFAVRNGQTVRQGELIGYIGSTGMSSGPHLDYQVWVKQGDGWVNVNPLEFGALELAP